MEPNTLVRLMIEESAMDDPRKWTARDFAHLYGKTMKVVDAREGVEMEQDLDRTRTVAKELLPLGVGMNAVARKLSLPVQAVVRALTSDSPTVLWLLTDDDWLTVELHLTYSWPKRGRMKLAAILSDALDLEISDSAIRTISRWYDRKPGRAL